MQTFDVLAEPRRRTILDLLRDGERSVGELVEQMDLSQPAVSKHLRVLREAGLVTVRVAAQRRCYRLRPDPLTEVDAWLAPYRRFWADRLDALERHLDAGPESTQGTPGTNDSYQGSPESV
ncbi:MAG: ArsR family transcriptional regulator [Amycolatopsis sp.]|jgi:DNA-binding transcriptional ArsR family regulator|uniref:ArsR/SmtB family transcription factor n=1 Tax=Amycolatopsis sp. TaxID=37632 RepID=UPI002618CF6A|nr:metalloregulator ArsR/SmtB family transcription factor [Amycolatopsis sp.]MCU1679355.1 ArsR family transcriptional regulator [Amycolatopsis sp.]